MSRFLCFLFVFLFQFTLFSQQNQGGGNNGLFIWCRENTAENQLKLTRLIHSFQGCDSAQVAKAFFTSDPVLDRIFSVKKINANASQVISKRLKQQLWIELVEDIPEYQFFYTPNDLLSNQWNLKKIQAENAWNLCKGGKNVIVALVDDGMDTAHSDLQGALWHNPKEIKGNGIDDDGNGYVDDYYGWDVADNDNDPCVIPSDGLNHGTHCAGIIGAVTDNSNGIASVGFNLKIMPLKCGKKGGGGSIFNPYQGVDYAISNGARIISMSWGGGAFSATYQALYDAAFKKGVVCVAAAGNSSTSAIMYPAGYNHVIAVGSTTSTDAISGFSNFGTWVDVMAPGSGIYSTLPGNTYGNMSGTSMACPLVSGLCGLMVSRYPLVTNTNLESCLKSSCDNINAANPAYTGMLGAGRINAYKAMLCSKSIYAAFTSSKNVVCTGDTVQFWDKSQTGATTWKWTFNGGTPSTSSIQNPNIKYNTSGNYLVQLIVSNGTDTDTLSITNYIVVGKPTVKFSGNQTIVRGDYGTIKVDFTGAGPWDLVYTDGKTNYSLNNITNNPQFILVLPDTNRTYKPVSVSQRGCSGTISDSAKITVVKRVGNNCDSAYRFQMRLGASGDETGYKILPWDDTSVLVAGRTTSYGSGSYDGFLARISLLGRTIWFKTYGGSGDDEFFTLALDDKKNIYTAGHTFSGTTQKGAWLLKLNSSGSILWKKHYDGSSLELVNNLVISRNKKYIYACGPSISNSFGSEDFTLYKFDTAGNVSWVKQIGEADFNRNQDLWEDSSGNIYTLGTQGVSYPYFNSAISKINSSGSVLWTKRYSYSAGGYNPTVQKGMAWKEKALFVYGFVGAYNGSTYSTKEAHVMRIDLSGNVIWDKKYTLGTMNATNATMIGDEMYLYGNYTSNGGDAFIIKIDTNGNVIKSVAIGGTSTSEDIQDVVSSNDGGIYFTGTDNTGGNNQIWIGKTNCSLSSLCNNTNVTPTVTSMSIGVASVSYSSQNFASITASVSTVSGSPKPTFACKSTFTVPNKPKCGLVADMQIVPACTGSKVFFYDRSMDNAGSTTTNLWWDFGDSSTAINTGNPTHIYKSNGTYKVQLIIKSVNGINTCLDSAEINYRTSDTLRMKKMTADTIICLGDSVKLTAPLLNCGNGPFKYAWKPRTGVSDTTLASPYFYPKKTTRYYLTVSDFTGIKIKDSFLITVNKNCCVSKARFQPVKPITCLGDSAFFVNTSTYKKNAVFKWKFTGGSIATYTGIKPPAIYFYSTGPHAVRLILSDSCTTDTFNSNVDVAPNPFANAGNDTTLCLPDTIDIGSSALDWYQYEWSPKTGINNAYISSPTIYVTSPTKYILKVTSDAGCVSYDSIVVSQVTANSDLGNDTTICTGSNIKLKSKIKATRYLWNTGTTVDSILVKSAGKYWLEIAVNGCKFRDTINVGFDTLPTFTLGKDTVLCENRKPFLITATNIKWPASVKLWDNNSTGVSRSVNNNGIYWLQMQNNKCIFRDSLRITFDTLPVFTLGNDTSLCENNSLVLSAQGMSVKNAVYLWNNGSSAKTLNAISTGKYWLQVINKNCVVRDSIQVVYDSMPIFTLGGDTMLCEDAKPLKLFARNIRIKQAINLWNNGSNTQFISVSGNGIYWLQKQHKTCIFRDSVKITFDNKPVFTLGNDTAFCTTGTSVDLQPKTPPGAGLGYTWDNGSTSMLRTVNRSGKYWLKVKNNTCVFTDTLQLKMDTIPVFTLGNDTSVCTINFPFNKSPKNTFAISPQYLWDNGNTSSVRIVNKPGTYFLIEKWGNCIYADSVKIDSLSSPRVHLPADTQICLGDTMALSAPIIANTTYLWNTGETINQKTAFNPGTYAVTLKNICGTAYDEIKIAGKDCGCPIYIPNSFSPLRSPGINDDYHLEFSCPYEYFEIMIYDRWGGIVFRSTDTAFKWNGMYKGSVVPNGTYMLVLKLKHKYENGGREFLRSGYLYVTD